MWRVTSLDANGYPVTFEVLAVGQGFNREDFQIELTSPTGNIAVADFKTGYNAVLGGVIEMLVDSYQTRTNYLII